MGCMRKSSNFKMRFFYRIFRKLQKVFDTISGSCGWVQASYFMDSQVWRTDMMGKFRYENIDDVVGKTVLDWKGTIDGCKPKRWWECWVKLAMFPARMSLWILVMFLAVFVAIVFVMPVIVSKHLWSKFIQELNDVRESFQ